MTHFKAHVLGVIAEQVLMTKLMAAWYCAYCTLNCDVFFFFFFFYLYFGQIWIQNHCYGDSKRLMERPLTVPLRCNTTNQITPALTAEQSTYQCAEVTVSLQFTRWQDNEVTELFTFFQKKKDQTFKP